MLPGAVGKMKPERWDGNKLFCFRSGSWSCSWNLGLTDPRSWPLTAGEVQDNLPSSAVFGDLKFPRVTVLPHHRQKLDYDWGPYTDPALASLSIVAALGSISRTLTCTIGGMERCRKRTQITFITKSSIFIFAMKSLIRLFSHLSWSSPYKIRTSKFNIN